MTGPELLTAFLHRDRRRASKNRVSVDVGNNETRREAWTGVLE